MKHHRAHESNGGLEMRRASLGSVRMSALSKLGEARIDEAIASGELAPPPAGTALDLEAYFQAPDGWRSAFAMLKGQGFAPPEIELMKQAEKLEARLADSGDASERIRLRREIDELRVRFRMAIERMRRE
ncbi:DUF1992 domain-containing protein [Luteolibacter arcticus]|uniref:DUF1992 domain-containing protein n=1 Tax=Luteolibacter arcticus TaxID=1581411 RepID=A0ABT3GN35_9BACT|nr:DUF1992 domain-containing protein [Luteolibacter arcticus]MCW1924921.1 DUF1992 domain-containing protein [Luteolibacter arcticus]